MSRSRDPSQAALDKRGRLQYTGNLESTKLLYLRHLEIWYTAETF